MTAEWTLPQDWKTVTNPSINKKLKSDNFKIFSVISVPPNFKSGRDAITLTIKKENESLVSKKINITIEEIHKVELSLMEKPKFVRAGKKFTYKYLIENKGNTDENIFVESKFPKDKITNVNIPVDSSKIITVNKYATGDYYSPTTKLTGIEVTGKNIDTLSMLHTFVIYPNASKRNDLFFYYPVKASAKYRYTETSSKNQFLLYNVIGSGYLNKLGKHFLEFGFTSAEGNNQIRYENLERKWIKYKYQENELFIGDFSLSFTSLLEQNRLGRGIYSKLNYKNQHLTLFYNQPRFFQEVKEQFGASSEFNFSNKYGMSLGMLIRRYADQNPTKNINISQKFNPSYGLYRLETAMSLLDNKKQYGIQFDGLTEIKGYEIINDILYTSPRFDGYYYNSTNIFTSVKKRLSKSFVLTNDVRYSLINPRPDKIIEQIAPIKQRYSSRIYYSPNDILKHGIALGFHAKKDRSAKLKFDFHEYLLDYMIKLRKGNFALDANASARLSSNNLIVDDERKKWSYYTTFSGSYLISNNFIVSGNVEYLNTNRYSSAKKNLLFFGANITYKYKDICYFGAGFRNNYELSEQYQQRSIFNINGALNINKNHVFEISGNMGRSSVNPSKKDIFFSMGYRLNLNIPISKSKKIGSLIGQLQSNSITDKSGILFNLDGYSSITDETGKFTFEDIAEGERYLTVDPTSLKIDNIVNEEFPMKILIEPKKEVKLDLSLVKPSRIVGKVNFIKSKQTQAKKFAKAIPQLIIKLEYGDKIQYTMTNEKNEFLFSQLNPGEYKIKIVSKRYEKIFNFKDNNQRFELLEGEDRKINFSVAEKTRNIRIKKKKFNLKSK